jgi:hypothetical protein
MDLTGYTRYLIRHFELPSWFSHIFYESFNANTLFDPFTAALTFLLLHIFDETGQGLLFILFGLELPMH